VAPESASACLMCFRDASLLNESPRVYGPVIV